MLADLTIETFRPHVGSTFQIAVNDTKQIEFTLERVDSLTDKHGTRAFKREPFSMTFVGPDDLILAQQLVPMDHPELGKLSIFLVPLGKIEGRLQYEAIFT